MNEKSQRTLVAQVTVFHYFMELAIVHLECIESKIIIWVHVYSDKIQTSNNSSRIVSHDCIY